MLHIGRKRNDKTQSCSTLCNVKEQCDKPSNKFVPTILSDCVRHAEERIINIRVERTDLKKG